MKIQSCECKWCSLYHRPLITKLKRVQLQGQTVIVVGCLVVQCQVVLLEFQGDFVCRLHAVCSAVWSLRLCLCSPTLGQLAYVQYSPSMHLVLHDHVQCFWCDALERFGKGMAGGHVCQSAASLMMCTRLNRRQG